MDFDNFDRFVWISTDFNGFRLISVDFDGFRLIFMDFDGFQWISMDFTSVSCTPVQRDSLTGGEGEKHKIPELATRVHFLFLMRSGLQDRSCEF